MSTSVKTIRHDGADAYVLLARLLRYPTPDMTDGIRASLNHQESIPAPIRDKVVAFASAVAAMKPGEAEDRYVATFDVVAPCCLDVGYSIFGEDYKRGQFMAEMKILNARHGVDCHSELPDHLPNVLQLMTRIPFGDASELALLVVCPAVEKMVEALKDSDNPYRHLLEAVRITLHSDFPTLHLVKGGCAHV